MFRKDLANGLASGTETAWETVEKVWARIRWNRPNNAQKRFEKGPKAPKRPQRKARNGLGPSFGRPAAKNLVGISLKGRDARNLLESVRIPLQGPDGTVAPNFLGMSSIGVLQRSLLFGTSFGGSVALNLVGISFGGQRAKNLVGIHSEVALLRILLD